MNTHNSAHITGKVATASSDGQVLNGVQSISVDHEVSVIFVGSGCLATVAAIEELGESFLLNGVDSVHVEPCGVAGEDDRMGLGDELFARSGFERRLGWRRLLFSHGILQSIHTFSRWVRLTHGILKTFGVALGIGLGATHLLVFKFPAVLGFRRGGSIEGVVGSTGGFIVSHR